MTTSSTTASLIIKVDSTSTRTGSAALDDLSKSAATAEKKVSDLNKSFFQGGGPAVGYADVAEKSAKATNKMAAEADNATKSAVKLSFATGQVSREIGIMGGEIARGNYTRFEGSLITLANRTGLLSALMSPLALGIATVAGGFGVMALAAAQAEKEQAAVNKAIALTGNYAGITSASVNALAKSMAGANGSLSDSRKAVLALASTGTVGADSLHAMGIAAGDLAALTGESADKAAAQIARMFDGTAAGAAKANDQYHFLTQSQYEQIAALEKMGNTESAARLEAEAFDNSIKPRIDAMTPQVYGLAAAWQAVSKAVSGVASTQWDKFKSEASLALGTADYSTQIADLQARKKAATPDANGRTTSFAGIVNNMLGMGFGPQEQAELDKLTALQKLQQQVADNSAANGKLNGDAIDAAITTNAIEQQFATEGEKKQAEITKIMNAYNKRMAAALNSGDQALYDQLQAKQADEIQRATAFYDKKGSKSAKSDPFTSINGLVQKSQVRDDNFGTQDKQTQQVTDILAIVDAGAKLIASGKDVAKVQALVATGVANTNEYYAKQAAQIKSQNVIAIAQYQASLDKQNDALQRTITSQIDKIGMGDKEYQQQQQINDLYVKGAEALTQLQLKRDGVAAKGGDTSVLDANIAALQANTDKQVQIVTAGYKQMDAARADWTNGLRSSLANYLDQAGDVAGQSAQLFTNAFNGMSDSLANFATTGKLNFKSLVASILSDLAKMEMRIAMSKILQSVLGAFLGSSGGNGQMATSFNSDGTFFSPYAKGGVVASPGLSAYSGHVVSQPTVFAFARGAGVMGEAGPEAIMPLSRGSDGKLGVKASGSSGGVVFNQVINVDGNGNASDKTSGSNDDAVRQFAGKMKSVAQQTILDEQRPGGSLWRMRQPA